MPLQRQNFNENRFAIAKNVAIMPKNLARINMLFNSYAFVVLVAITMIFYYAPNVAFRGGAK